MADDKSDVADRVQRHERVDVMDFMYSSIFKPFPRITEWIDQNADVTRAEEYAQQLYGFDYHLSASMAAARQCGGRLFQCLDERAWRRVGNRGLLTIEGFSLSDVIRFGDAEGLLKQESIDDEEMQACDHF